MNNRIIIENRSKVDDALAVYVVGVVISRGRISNDGKQYCLSTFKDHQIAVYTDLNKSSDRFVVSDLPIQNAQMNSSEK